MKGQDFETLLNTRDFGMNSQNGRKSQENPDEKKSINSKDLVEEYYMQKLWYDDDENPDEVSYRWDPNAEPDQASNKKGDKW